MIIGNERWLRISGRFSDGEASAPELVASLSGRLALGGAKR